MQKDFMMEQRWLLMHLKIKYFHFTMITMKKTGLKMKMKMILGMEMVLLIIKMLYILIFLKERDINGELVRKHLLVQDWEHC